VAEDEVPGGEDFEALLDRAGAGGSVVMVVVRSPEVRVVEVLDDEAVELGEFVE
jgi:hypothetical protein